MKHPKLLVAGAGGLNGRLLLKKLAENNIPVRAMVRNKESTKELENETTEIVEADLSSPAALDRAFERISLPPYIRMLQHISAIFFRLPKKPESNMSSSCLDWVHRPIRHRKSCASITSRTRNSRNPALISP